MEVRPLTPGFGVELLDLDINAALNEATAAAFRDLFYKHHLLLIRGQAIDAHAQIRLVNSLAPVGPENPGGDNFSFVSTKPQEIVSGRQAIPFHSDYSFTSYGPIRVISLYILEMDQSEPTTYANSIAAVRNLPTALRDRLRAMEVVQCQSWDSEDSGGTRMHTSRYAHLPPDRLASAVHPAIMRHKAQMKKFL